MTGRTIVTFNLKQDLPTVEEARQRLIEGLARMAEQGVTLVRVVHGYGSTGVGGAIRKALPPTFRRLQRDGVIRFSIPGEDWKVGHHLADQLVREHPDLRRDPDHGAGNRGITIVAMSARRREKRAGGPGAAAAPQEVRPADKYLDADRLIESDPDYLYDRFSQPHMIRKHKPDG